MFCKVAFGEEHLFLPLLGDADGSHGHINLARLHGWNLRGELHGEKLQLPVATVGPLAEQVYLQASGFAGTDETERRKSRVDGYVECATRAAPLRPSHRREVVGVTPSVNNLLVGAVAADICQETVEVLLQFCVVQLEASSDGCPRQAGIHGIHLRGYLLVERHREIIPTGNVHLAVLQRSQQIGATCNSHNVGIG